MTYAIPGYDAWKLHNPADDRPEPVMCWCEACKGKGTETVDGVEMDCEECDGTGEVEDTDAGQEPDADDSRPEPWELDL